MDHAWIETYGPWAVLLGGIFEGETVFIAAGYAVSQGYLDPLTTFLLAALGGSAGDLMWYGLGRWNGPRLIRRVKLLQKVRARATLLLRRWGRSTAFFVRFAYGLRLILPLTMGAAHFSFRLFVPFNALGSLAFAGVYLLLGFFFGEAVEGLLQRIEGAESWVLAGIAVLGVVAWAMREWKIFHTENDAGWDGEV